MKASSRIIIFVTFFTERRKLVIGTDESKGMMSRVGAPQGGVLSPLLFKLVLSRIFWLLAHHVKRLMFVDNLILYVWGKNISLGCGRLQVEVDALVPWFHLSPVGSKDPISNSFIGYWFKTRNLGYSLKEVFVLDVRNNVLDKIRLIKSVKDDELQFWFKVSSRLTYVVYVSISLPDQLKN